VVLDIEHDLCPDFSTIGSPQLLELSGIGRLDVIDKIEVELQVELPGVGENVQEHILLATVYETDPDKSFDTLEIPHNTDELVIPRCFAYLPLSTVNPEGTAEVIKKVEQEVEALKQSGTLPPGQADLYDATLNTLRNPEVPDFQLCFYPGNWPGTGVLFWHLRAT
jgi:choline dehydrogenase-like flavoprotein